MGNDAQHHQEEGSTGVASSSSTPAPAAASRSRVASEEMLTQLDGPAICAVGRRHLDYSGELPEQMEQGRSTKTGKGGKERMVSSSSALCSPAAPSPFLCLDSPPTSRPSHSLLCSLTGGMASREPTLPFTPSSRRVQATRGQEVEADVRFLLSLFFFFCARVVHCTHSIATVALADGAGYADGPPLFISTAVALGWLIRCGLRRPRGAGPPHADRTGRGGGGRQLLARDLAAATRHLDAGRLSRRVWPRCWWLL